MIGFIRATFFLFLIIPAASSAGSLVSEFHSDECKISTYYNYSTKFGLIKLTSKYRDGKLGWCQLSVNEVQITMKQSLQYIKRNIPFGPITGVQIGSLRGYNWMKTKLDLYSATDNINKSTIYDILKSEELLKPFVTQLEKENLYIKDIGCEEIEYRKNNSPTNAFCYLSIMTEP